MRRVFARFAPCFLLIVLGFSVLPGSSIKEKDELITSTAEEKNYEHIVRVATDVIQVDVSVLDKKGQPLSDLTIADFEVYENGELRPITNLLFVPEARLEQWGIAPDGTLRQGVDHNSLNPQRLTPVHQTLVMVVDDRGLSFDSIHPVRSSLKKYVKTMMQPGDLAALICTGTSLKAMQQFTSDREELLAAIDRIQYNSRSRAGIHTVRPKEYTPKWPIRAQGGKPAMPAMQRDDAEIDAEYHHYHSQVSVLGSLRTIGAIIEDLDTFPGRKTVAFFQTDFRSSTARRMN